MSAIHDELVLSPFKRSIAGLRGTVILRRNDDHEALCRKVIQRRQHPAWSSQGAQYRVTA